MSFITLSEARAMVALYQERRPEILQENVSTDILPLSITLPKDEITELLSQNGAESCRVYFGMQEDNEYIDVILVAADENGNDIVPDQDYLIIDRGARCPHVCPTNSALNP